MMLLFVKAKSERKSLRAKEKTFSLFGGFSHCLLLKRQPQAHYGALAKRSKRDLLGASLLQSSYLRLLLGE